MNIPEKDKEMWMNLIEIIYTKGFNAGSDYVMSRIENQFGTTKEKDSDVDDLK